MGKVAIAKGGRIMGVERESKEMCTKKVVQLDFQQIFDEGPQKVKKLPEHKEKNYWLWINN